MYLIDTDKPSSIDMVSILHFEDECSILRLHTSIQHLYINIYINTHILYKHKN